MNFFKDSDKWLWIAIFLLFSWAASSQTIIKGTGIIYFADTTQMNAFVPNIAYAAEMAVVVNNGRPYTWDRIQSKWVLIDNGGTDDQILSFAGTTLSIENGNSVNLSSLQDGTGTDDQVLSLAGTTLTLENGGSVNLSVLQDGTGTDDQTLNLVGTTLSIENGNSVNLSSVQDGTGTDDQTLGLTGTTLSIENGNSVNLSFIQDGTGTDDQTINLVGDTLSIENGNSVILSGFLNTDDQTLSLAGTTLSIEDGNSVDLSGLQDGTGTDNQTINLVGTTLSIEDGNSVDLSGLQDGTGTDDQTLNLVGTTLSIEDGNSVDLSGLQDGTGTDDQTLGLAGTTLSIEDGNSVDLSGLQDGTGTDDQQLSLASNILTLEDGGSVNLSGYLDNTDDQTLNLVGTTLSIEDGNSVDLSGLQDGTGTDDQTLNLVGTTLSIEDGNSVDLSGLQDGTGTDDQTLNLVGTTLSIEDGNSVDLSGLQDGNTNIYNANGSLPAATIRSIQFGSNASRFRYLDPDNADQYFELFNNSTLSGKAGMYILDDDLGSNGNIGEIGPSVYGVLTAATASVKGGFASLINTPGTTFFAVDGSNIARIQSSAADYRIGNPGTSATLLQTSTQSWVVTYDDHTGNLYKQAFPTPTTLTHYHAQLDKGNTSTGDSFTGGSYKFLVGGYGLNASELNGFSYNSGTGELTYTGASGKNFLINISMNIKTSSKLTEVVFDLWQGGTISTTTGEFVISPNTESSWQTLSFNKVVRNLSTSTIFKFSLKSTYSETLEYKNIHISFTEF
ncbi:MAG: hypothetical protein KDC85_18340 [Saprospiraceae bacterium]|nr:hypothetical protein [Saprospiraceae bacterium]